MKIIVRYKDGKGRTAGYKVENRGKYRNISAESAIRNASHIENAVLLSNKEFRAKAGCHIDTLLCKEALRVKKSSGVMVKANKSDNVGNDISMMGVKGAEFIKKCREIQRCAEQGNIRIDYMKHKSNRGLNTHLFKLIEACGISVENFVRGYLSVLQPCFMEPFQKSKIKDDKDCVWVCDPCYKLKMLIKIKRERDNYVVVSFHESNTDGRGVVGGHYNDYDNCAVLTEDVNRLSDSAFEVKFIVQRGFLRDTVECTCSACKNGVAIVKYYEIKNVFNTIVKGIIDNVMIMYNERTHISVSHDNGVLSFMSYGATAINQVCMLIDIYSRCNNQQDRGIIASVTYKLVNEMSEIRQEELKLALKHKFEGSSIQYNNELYKSIMEAD